MSEIVNTAPKFVVVLSGESRPQNQSVAILMGTADKKKFGLEFDASVVPAAVTALIGLLGKVVSALPTDQQPPPQVLKTVGMTLAMNADGQIGFVYNLEGGAELTFQIKEADLPALRGQIDEAIEFASRNANKH